MITIRNLLREAFGALERPAMKQLRPCLMFDYGCQYRALTHLFCPNHWVQIHLDDREALDNPLHERCTTFGPNPQTGVLGRNADREKHRNLALKVVEALALKEAKEAAANEPASIDDLHKAQEVLIACGKCGVTNAKTSALQNSCGNCGEMFPREPGMQMKREACVPTEKCAVCHPDGEDNNGICWECATMKVEDDGEHHPSGKMLPEFGGESGV